MSNQNHDWHMDASGNKFARRLPTQPDERHYLYGPGTGKSDRSSRRTDRIFDGLATIILIALGIAVTVGMLGMLKTPEPAQLDRSTIECSR